MHAFFWPMIFLLITLFFLLLLLLLLLAFSILLAFNNSDFLLPVLAFVLPLVPFSLTLSRRVFIRSCR